ncbi:putative Rho GTPase-activating protein At5g61530 [Carex rostrata]
MALDASPPWRQKATAFFASSARGDAADVAGKVNSMVKDMWAVFKDKRQSKQERAPSKETVQERHISVASLTTVLLRKAKRTLNNIERWQKGVASNGVFGVPIEVIVQREQSNTAVPQVLIACLDYLMVSGLSSEYFKSEEDKKKTIKHLISLFNEDWKASIPDGINPIYVASLVKCYLSSLLEPLITFVLFNEIGGARSRICELKNILRKLPSVNYMTLEFVTAFLLQVSQKSSFNGYLYLTNLSPHPSSSIEEEDLQIPLDDAAPPDYGVIEVIQCLIEHHNAVFTDANETIWR